LSSLLIRRKLKLLVKRLTTQHAARNLFGARTFVPGNCHFSRSICRVIHRHTDIQGGDLVQLLGISGVAIGFAFRILQNFLAGILILLAEPFRLDDQIVFKEFEGTVENIQTRATTIRTYDGRHCHSEF